MRFEKSLSMGLVLLMVVSGFAGLTGGAANENAAMKELPPSEMAYTAHAPIRINSNSDFDATHGVMAGNGTQADPYVIENYDIDGSGNGSCLYIGNTTAYFVVRNCSFHDASENSGMYYWDTGVVLHNVTNGRLSNNTASSNSYYGIYLHYSYSNTVINNTVSNNGYGIYIYHSNTNAIANNMVSSNDNYGIYLFYQSRGNTLSNNIVSNDYRGIYLSASSSNSITNNTVSSNSQLGIFLYYSDSNNITSNTASNNSQGIYLYDSSSNTITNNTASNNYHGLLLNSASNNTIANSTSSNCTYGITVADTDNARVHNNTCINNIFGIYMDNSTNVDVRGNTVDNERQYYGIMNPSGVDLGSYQVPVNVSYTDGIRGNFSNIRFFDENNQTVPYWIEEYETGSWAKVWLNLSSIPAEGTTVSMSVLDASAPSGSNGSAVFYYFEDFKNDADGWAYTEDDDNGYYDGMRNDTYWNTTDNWSYMLRDSDPSGTPYNPAASYLRLSTDVNAPSSAKVVWDGKIGSWSMSTGFSQNDFEAEFYMDGARQWNNNKLNGGEHPEFDDMEYDLTPGSHNIYFQVYRNAVLWSGTSFHFFFDTVRVRNYTSPEPYAVSTTGILLNDSDLNTVNGNTIGGMDSGISMKGSGFNNIFSNRIYNSSGYGISADASSGWNIMYLNNLEGNNGSGVQAFDAGGNEWDRNMQGNYWSDYGGADSFSGPNQDIIGSDGIGDTPYTNIASGSGSQDNYPLMYPTSYTPLFLGNTPWPMFSHDIFHTGISPYNSSAGAWLYWNFITGGEVSGSAAITDDGTIYTGSSDGKLYAINPDGTEKWNFTADGSINGSSPAIANDGTIYFGTMNGTLHALYPNGTEKWNHSIGSPILSSPVIGSDGTIYIGANDGKLYAIQQNGTEKWNYSFSSNITSPVIDQDGKIIFSSYNNYTFSLNPNGTLNWWVDLHSNISASPMILKGGYDYIAIIACMDGNVYGLYTTNGTLAGNVNVGAPVSSTPVYAEPHLYIADESGTVHAFNTSNNMSNDWNFTTGGAIYSSPAIDARGNLFFGSADGKIYAISSNESEVWNYTVGSPVNGSPAINEGMLYIGSADGGLYAIGDTTPPSVGIDSPSNGTILNSANVTVSWHGSDATSGINHYEVRNDSGTWVDVGTDTSYTFTGLSDGSHAVGVKVIDNASNENTTSVTFTVDTTAPEITIDSPSDGAILNTANITVSWSGSDATSGINHYEVRNASGSWIDVGLNITYNFTGLSDGLYTVDVKAIDNAGNENTTSVTFTVDTTAPEVTIDSPSNGTILNTANVTVSWTGSDATSGIDHYEVRSDSGNWTNVGLNTSYNFTGLSDGSHTAEVKVIDNASNENTTSVTLIVDATPPEITITAPSDGTIFDTTTVTVSWTGSDSGSGTNHYEIRKDGVLWIDVGTNTSYTFTNLSDDSHTVDVKAVDNATNEVTYSLTFTTDTTNPTVSITSPSNGTIFNTNSVTVSWSASDASGIDHYNYRIDGGAWSADTTATSYTFSGLSEGSHTVEVMATDGAGNTNTATVTFTVDTVAPSITITSPTDNTLFNTDSITIDWSGSDTTSGVDHYNYRIDGGAWSADTTATGYTFSGLLDGNHTVEVMATDGAGNTNTTTVTFTIDTTAPTITQHSPTGQNVSVDTRITVSFSEDMDTSSVEITVSSLSGTVLWNGSTAVFTPAANLNAGTTYFVNVTGTDTAGNPLARYMWNFSTAMHEIINPPVESTTGNISGVVVDENGDPVAGATVTVQGTNITAITDSTGHFLLENVSAGSHNLTVSGDGFNDTVTSVTVSDGGTATLNPVLHPITSQPPTTEFPWWIIIVAIAAILVVVALFMGKKGGKSNQESVVASEEKTAGDGADAENEEKTDESLEESSQQETEKELPTPEEDILPEEEIL